MVDLVEDFQGGKAMKNMFDFYDALSSGYIGAMQVQRLHQEIRIGGISLPQVIASIEHKKLDQHRIYLNDLPELLQEMDRRYYLVQGLQWEFALLDHEHRGFIPAKSARFLMEARHGKSFSNKQWEKFLNNRTIRLAPISFAEIEVPLCNIWKASMADEAEMEIIDDENERRLQAEEKARKKEAKRVAEIEKKKKEEEMQKAKEQEERRKEAERVEQEAKRKQAEEAHRLEEERRMKSTQDAEADDKVAEEEEKLAQQQQRMLADAVKKEADAAKKKKAEKEAAKAAKKAEEARKKRIRTTLKVAVESRHREKLTKATADFKAAKLSDDDGDLAKAERLLEMFKCSDALKDGISKRLIDELESSVRGAKKKGFHKNELEDLVLRAEELMIRLRHLERLRHEVLELKSSTIAEIRSYQKPPSIVHNVMIATYLLLGTSEKETKKWPYVQVLLGKTGREGLKRRIMQLKVTDIDLATAKKARTEMGEIDLEIIRDVSAGAATFYVWADGMIEEALSG